MDPQTNYQEELLATWRALSGSGDISGWKTIPIAHAGSCRFLAGRHFPGNEESLLIGFTSMRVPPVTNLPHGKGFQVRLTSLTDREAEYTWIALSKEDSGNLDLFTLMATDVINTIQRYPKANDERIFNLFLSRIRAWQDFMREDRDKKMSQEAEMGLWGELFILQRLIASNISPNTIVDGWQGPLKGVQDFCFETGAVEVKTTATTGSFPAKIGSLLQLDDSLIKPIFLAAVRLEISPHGATLSDLSAELHNQLIEDPVAQSMLEDKLLRAGLLPGIDHRYIQKFTYLSMRIFHVTDEFPRLTKGNVAVEIRGARYEIDIDLIPSQEIDLPLVITELGLI